MKNIFLCENKKTQFFYKNWVFLFGIALTIKKTPLQNKRCFQQNENHCYATYQGIFMVFYLDCLNNLWMVDFS